MAIDQPTATISAAGITAVGAIIAAWINKSRSKTAITASEAGTPAKVLERLAFKIRVSIYVFWGSSIALSIGYFLYYTTIDRPTKLFVIITVIAFAIYLLFGWCLSWLFEQYLVVRKIIKERKSAQPGATANDHG